jgi:hypothetical protein
VSHLQSRVIGKLAVQFCLYRGIGRDALDSALKLATPVSQFIRGELV